MQVRVEPWGPEALLVRVTASTEGETYRCRRGLERWLAERPPLGLVEVTSGHDTVLLEFEGGRRPQVLEEAAGGREWVASLERVAEAVLRGEGVEGVGERRVELPVVYDGPDLGRVARQAGMGEAEVVALHAAAEYRVLYLGFAPGFAYLGGLDPRLHTPRLGTPRMRVPAGSVAIGGGHAGVYPLATAGGWNLLGRTGRVLLDEGMALAGREEAFLLRPGDWVRFVPVPALAAGNEGAG